MMEKDKFDNSLNFVSRHYRANAFSTKEGLEKIGIGEHRWWKQRWVAAAAVGVVLAASAAVYSIVQTVPQGSDEVPVVEQQIDNSVKPAEIVKKITFEDADLATVVNEIEKVYDVKIVNMPDKEYHVTLSYEGNAADLVDTINELLGTNLKISK
jgi:hypothetical protein